MTSVNQPWNLEMLSDVFRRAGEIAMAYFEAPPAELKSDQTVVTAAYKEIEAMFAELLDRPAEGSYLIGEETVESHSAEYITQALQSSSCWVLDPIDGTAPYSVHMDFWGISLGFMEQGCLTEGAVYLPCYDILLATDSGEVFFRKLSEKSDWQKFIPARDPLNLKGHVLLGQMPAHKWCFAARNTLFALSSCVASLYLLLCGKAIAYCGNFKLWDIAGFLPILNNLNYPILSCSQKHSPLSGDLRDQMFELADPRRMWYVKEPIIAAPDEDTALALLKEFYNNEPAAELKI